MIEISEVKGKRKVHEVLEELEPEYQYHNSTVPLKELSKKIATHGVTLQIEVDNQLAGCCSFYCNDMESKTGYISKIAIKKEFQGMSLGKQILSEAEKISKQNKMKKMRLEVADSNKNAIKLYEKCGYSRVGETTHNSHYMEKSIGRKK